jgi:predicted SAM-dependent methyltransferase
MQMLNIGCGRHHHSDWINIDIVSRSNEVIEHDITKGIPLPNSSCDVVYHSHLIEHLRHDEVLGFLNECYRVLRPVGVLRMVTPDLERIARTYLQVLEEALAGRPGAGHNYEWILLEMYDQTVREYSGGRMKAYLAQDSLPNEEFVLSRIGQEALQIRESLSRPRGPDTRPAWRGSLRRKAKKLPQLLRKRLARLLLTRQEKIAFNAGMFRFSGEVHHWMYDRYSLRELLSTVGFVNVEEQMPSVSRIPDWTHYNLDTSQDGRVRKPDSFFVEATRPASG